MITGKTLRPGLRTHLLGNRVISFETIDSTNNCAKAVAGCGGNEGTIVFAEHQTSGRGRHGRPWTANPNENLTFSIILRPSISPEHIQSLSLLSAVAIAEAVERETGLRSECKWPNDLLIRSKKFGGILLEGSITRNSVEHVVIGIGLNINQVSFPPELADKATSLRIESGRTIDRIAMLRAVLQSLERHYEETLPGGMSVVTSLWLRYTSMLNKQVSVLRNGSEAITGIMKGLSPEGGIILHTNGTDRVLFAGDTTVLGTPT
jgi:BirA family biotin operon repressor/biotin-[acetyl-CoA-carboxylase] ligase